MENVFWRDDTEPHARWVGQGSRRGLRRLQQFMCEGMDTEAVTTGRDGEAGLESVLEKI